MSSNPSKLFISAVALRGCESWKEWNKAICSNRDRPRDHDTKWNVRKRQSSWYHLHVEPKKMIQMKVFTKQTHRHRK